MRCEEEEEELPEDSRQLGLPPHLHPNTAFVHSWSALQVLYEKYQPTTNNNNGSGNNSKASTTNISIASIGVSNFDVNDLQKLQPSPSAPVSSSLAHPHILQGNIWSYLFDPNLISYCQTHSIHFQAYNVINGIYNSNTRQRAPRSAAMLHSVTAALVLPGVQHVTASQVLLKYLTMKGLSVIPRTTSSSHLEENGMDSIVAVPVLSHKQEQSVRTAIRGLMEGRDPAPTPPNAARFVNGMVEEVMHLFWKDVSTGEEKRIAAVAAGEEVVQNSWPGHVFVVYAGGDERGGEEVRRKEFVIGGGDEGEGESGGYQNFHVEF